MISDYFNDYHISRGLNLAALFWLYSLNVIKCVLLQTCKHQMLILYMNVLAHQNVHHKFLHFSLKLWGLVQDCIHLIAWSRTILSLWKQLASCTLFCIWYVDFHPILKTLKASKIIFPVFKGSLYTYFFLWFWSTWMLKNLYFSSCNKYSILVTYQKTLVVVNIITCVPLHVLSHIN